MDGRLKEVRLDRNGDTVKVALNGKTVKTVQKDGRNEIVTDEKGNVTRKEYDEWDNLTRIVHPDNTVETNSYEHSFHHITRKVYENGGVTEFEYDPDTGDLLKKTEAVGTADERVTEYIYENGNPVTITRYGASGQTPAVTRMVYDTKGNLTQVTDPEVKWGRATLNAHLSTV